MLNFRSLALILSMEVMSLSAPAQVDPKIEWKNWQIPGFDIIYDAKRQDVADLYAARLLKIPQIVKTYFPHTPEKTVFVIMDRTDQTNGYATPLPYGTIVVYPVLPGPNESISDIGDWAKEIALHEYTHASSFEHRRGAVLGLYYVFGNVITPNLLLPRWWLEGVAVDLETRTSQFGRLRSPLQDADIRALTIDSQWLNRDISEINETSIHTWPQGARPYLYGSLMWNEMIRKYGTQVIQELHHRYGGRFPFFIEAPIQDKGHGSYSDHFAEVKVHLYQKVQEQRKVLSQVPGTVGSKIPFKNALETFHPALSPDGLKLIALAKDDSNKRSVRIISRKSTNEEFNGFIEYGEIDSDLNESFKELSPKPKISTESCLDESLHNHNFHDGPPGGTIQRLSWFPNSEKFVFDKLDTVDRFHETSELYVYDLNSKKSEQITFNERAREAAVSPDGKKIVFVKLGPSQTSLAIFDLPTKKVTELLKPDLQTRISFPSFIDDNTLVFSERAHGQENLKLFSLKTKIAERLAPEYKDARFPWVTELNRQKGILFSSTINGVPNSYFYDLKTETVTPLTHTSTAITSANIDIQRKHLIASELTSTGYELRNIPILEKAPQRLPAKLPKVSPLLADDYPLDLEKNKSSQIASKEELNTHRTGIQDYSSWPYILPRYWLPNLGFYNNGAYLGGSFAGSDPLAKHQYSASLVYDTKPQTLSDQFIYTNNQTEAMISLLGLDYKNSVPNTNVNFRLQQYSVQSLWEISSLSHDLYAGLGYTWLGRDYAAPYLAGNTESHGPSLIAQYSDISQSGAQISPESGQQALMSITHFAGNKAKENESFNQVDLTAQKFWKKWLPSHHVVLTRFAGQYIDRSLSEVRSANYAFTLPSNPFASQLPPFIVMRGYQPAQFLAKNIATYTFEYRFPVAYPYMGSGTTPLFFKKVHMAAVSDVATLEGFSYNRDLKTYQRVGTWQSFWSAGLELKSDLTIGFHFPVTFMLGFYKAFNAVPGGETSFNFNIQM